MAETDPVEAWRGLCARLAALAPEAAGPDAADGVRHLARQVAFALEEHLEHSDSRHPSFHRYEAPWSQWGAPNPDNVYLRATIDPQATYRVWGTVTGVRDVLISLVEGDMHLDEYGVYAERSIAELEVAPDGTLSLVVSPDGHPGNWLQTHPRARTLLIRQYQCDWEHDAVTTFHIERVDTRGDTPGTPRPAEVATALERTARWVERSVRYWSAYSSGDSTAPSNAVGPPQTPSGGAPHIAYSAGRWSLRDDEALLVTTEVPDADYWSWAAHRNHQFDSGDFASRSTSINHSQAYLDTDNRLRLVVASADPGVPNWIDTSGRPAGMLAYRLIGARTTPAPSAQVVRLAQVRDHLPADHPRVDAATRRDQLARRRIAVLARYS